MTSILSLPSSSPLLGNPRHEAITPALASAPSPFAGSARFGPLEEVGVGPRLEILDG